MRKITKHLISLYKTHLLEEEKAPATIEKYIRDVTTFCIWVKKEKLDKTVILNYKRHISQSFAPASVNSMISSINSFFTFNGWLDLKVKTLKIQRQIFLNKNKELTKNEYESLLNVAKSKNKKLYLLMQTICSSGIRVSELCHITVEAAKQQQALIKCKGKMRIVILPHTLCKALLQYAKNQNIPSGCIFVTKSGAPLDRSNIWKMMKALCKIAKVEKSKVFPHNLRHLFARTFYNIQKDIVRLADILGHSSIDTTRIYTMESGEIHREQIQNLGLIQT